MSDVTDRDLIARCLAGESAAFGDLIERYQTPLYNTALRLTGDVDEAKDITQSVFVKAYEKLGEYKAEYKFFSWVYRMLVNESINHLKHRSFQQPLDQNLTARDKNPAELHEAKELREGVEGALLDLQLEYRLVIMFRYFYDLSYREMSYVLDLPVKTVRSRLYTARRMMATLLNQRGITTA